MEAFIERGLFMDAGKGKHTIEEIYALPEGERAELIDGELYMMSTPATVHQRLLTKFMVEIYNYVQKKKGDCEVFPAPFSVFLKKDDSTYVEPDISVVCAPDKVDEKGCHGAPDLVIEIVSPSSKKLDYVIKLAKYQEAGVREYWIVDPEQQIILVYLLDRNAAPVMYHFTDKVPVGIYEDFEIDFTDVRL